jgi:DNA-directed RNA polymerase I, II, and III subunit RPABC1
VFCPPEPIRVAVIREVFCRTKEDNLSCLILILQSKMGSKARDTIKELFKFKVDVFQVSFL